MPFSIKKYSIHFILFLSLLVCPFLAKAQSIENELSTAIQPEFSPSTIALNSSDENIVLVKNDIAYFLPKIEITRTNHSWEETNKQDVKLVENFSNLFQEVNEILSLSNKLGFRIRDPKHLDLYREAANWLGTRYRWAGKSEKGVDCSGLTNILMKKAYDKDLDRSSHIIANNVKETLEVENLQPGDLVFFSTMRRKGISHVGVYLGDGNFIHASRKGVVVSRLDESYYSRTLRKAGRI